MGEIGEPEPDIPPLYFEGIYEEGSEYLPIRSLQEEKEKEIEEEKKIEEGKKEEEGKSMYYVGDSQTGLFMMLDEEEVQKKMDEEIPKTIIRGNMGNNRDYMNYRQTEEVIVWKIYRIIPQMTE